MQFMDEALGISLAGGLLGLAISVGTAVAVTLIGLLTTAITISSVVLALGFSRNYSANCKATNRK
jgi:hypothetical protein